MQLRKQSKDIKKTTVMKMARRKMTMRRKIKIKRASMKVFWFLLSAAERRGRFKNLNEKKQGRSP